MNDIQEVKAVIGQLGTAVTDFKAEYNSRLDKIETILGRGGCGGGSHRGDGSSKDAETREHGKAFSAWARSGNNENTLRGLELRAAMHTESDPDGGFSVPEEMDKNIERLAQQSIAMRRIANVITKKGQYKKPVSQGGAAGGWVGERDTRPETDSPTLSLWEPPYREIYANPSTTQVLLDDADFDVEAWLTEEIADVFLQKEGTGFISGNSVGQVSGILNYTPIANANYTLGEGRFSRVRACFAFE